MASDDGRSAGYVTDVGYTRAYHPELNPLATRLAFLGAGLEPPRIATACELGFGQGVSLAVHAAATPVRWWGCDLLPEHVRFAQALDEAAGSGSVLAEATFAEFAARDDLPPFDFIGLHGVLSWVSAENRAVIARFIARRLAPGGVVYTSCNTLAGWASMLPLRSVMAEYAQRAADGDTPARIGAALGFTARLLDTHPRALHALPDVPLRFERLKDADRRYLAHEYFNRDWQPFGFADLDDLLAPAGLRHACPAHLRDQVPGLQYTADQRRLLAEITDARLRAVVAELMGGGTLRRDYWVRDPQPLGADALESRWRDTRIVATMTRAEAPERLIGPQGELDLAGRAHAAVLDALESDGPRTVGSIGERASIGSAALAAAVFDLAAAGIVRVAQDADVAAACAPRAARLNAWLDAHAPEVAVRASSVTGGAATA